MLRTRSCHELIEEDSKMLLETRSLDGDMQMLVYENYNKFISATETIKRMKSNVESMESDMLTLKFVAILLYCYVVGRKLQQLLRMD